jgi:hypothetical protein
VRRFGQGWPRVLRSFSIAAVAAVLVAVSACAHGSGERRPAAVPLPPDYAAMLAQVAAERGLAPPSTLRIGTVPRDSLPAVLDAASTGDDARLTRLSTIYRLLGLLPEGVDYAAASRSGLDAAVGAFYVPGKREVWLVRDGPLPGSPAELEPWEQRLLAHEFAHALQDYHFDIPALERAAGTTDAWLALRALLEGDAAWTESRWTASVLLPRLSPGAAVEPPAASAAPPPAIAREVHFQYVNGTEWVALLRGSDPAAVDRLLRDASPLATALVLHPDLPRTGWTPSGVAIPPGVPADGWQANDADSLGEFLLASYLQSALPALPSFQAAAGWAADTIQLYRTATGRPAMAWRIRFQDSKEAGEFASRHRELLERRADRLTERPEMLTADRRDNVTVVQLEPQGNEVALIFAGQSDAAEVLARYLLNR